MDLSVVMIITELRASRYGARVHTNPKQEGTPCF